MPNSKNSKLVQPVRQVPVGHLEVACYQKLPKAGGKPQEQILALRVHAVLPRGKPVKVALHAGVVRVVHDGGLHIVSPVLPGSAPIRYGSAQSQLPDLCVMSLSIWNRYRSRAIWALSNVCIKALICSARYLEGTKFDTSEQVTISYQIYFFYIHKYSCQQTTIG